MCSYLTYQDNLLRKLKTYRADNPTRDEMQIFLNVDTNVFGDIVSLLQTKRYVRADNTKINITTEGREFISYTSFQNEYDKKFAKELYETAVQNDYVTTRKIAVAAILVAGATLLLEVLKMLFPSLRH